MSKLISTFIGFFLGLLVPISFVFIDLNQLKMEIEYSNFLEIINSQSIYFFSFITLPSISAAVFFLLHTLYVNQKEAKEQQYFYLNILNSVTDSIVVADKKGNIIISNKHFSDNFSDKENISALIPQFSSEMEFFKGQQMEVSLSHKGYFLLTLNEFNQQHKTGDYFVISLKNINDIKENQKIIDEQKLTIEHSSRLSSLGEMAAGFAHEINNPLSIISANNLIIEKLLKKMKLDMNGEKVQRIFKYTDSNQKTVLRITKIISSLRNLSRDSGLEPFLTLTLDELVQDVSPLIGVKLHNTGIKFQLELDNFLETKVYCRPIQVSQVIINLVNNAVDALDEIESPDKWIKIKASASQGFLELYFMDSGKGISDDLVEKIFQPMFTTKEVGKGTGLGLSLSKTIIKKNKGELFYLKGAPNTTFVMRILLDKRTSLKQVS